jgi:iron-sulfur cluster repair protein YtfE (RIC family)
MSHGCNCGCGHGDSKPLTVSLPKPTAEMTVEQIKSRPGALEILQAFGLNHCCGAHLTLREAAASAGVRVEEILKMLAEPGARV